MYRNLLRPFSYLSIDHAQKRVIDWIFPVGLAVLSAIFLFWLKRYGSVPIYADGALISKVLGFVQGLPGFYIAALAAIATFNRKDIDKTMPYPAPKVDITIQGQIVPIELTRRRFLCSMFAFLTAESLVLIVLAILGQAIYMPIRAVVPLSFHGLVSFVYVLVFFVIFWQMIVTSFWGLFYLGEKLHQPDQ